MLMAVQIHMEAYSLILGPATYMCTHCVDDFTSIFVLFLFPKQQLEGVISAWVHLTIGTLGPYADARC